ncbi:MAG: peptide deformylase [Clostridiales bacterium]|nr:peptide deformylase [Clostridiales bacterium]
MALRNIVTEGDPILRKKSRTIEEITPRIVKLLDDMAETMYYDNRGIGLAAVQVGVLRRAFVVDIGDEHGRINFINPEITSTEGEQRCSEGCLSVPGKGGEVMRPMKIHVKALDIDGNPFEMDAEGLLADCICHEYDHLDGILFTDKAIPGTVEAVERE